ncbi:hypothetical protein FQN60_017379 [Etheostoma spectabile]|uniref:Uncharacterized protein n=1 Tax=Etheostoma spectabile TaxID=54343 RepID=A0A5J5DF86_9PERO|nr:hypothetical protein FQN60_017379 [Etheostoma spectabile]
MAPIATVEQVGFKKLLKTMDPRYELPSRNYFTREALPQSPTCWLPFKGCDVLWVIPTVRKADPSRLVFIDNAGRPQQSTNNLNFLLVEGIDEFPERAVSVLQSGCLHSLLLRSLYTDREFWDSRGGASGLRPLIHTVERRGQILLQHIRDRKLQLNRDL